MLGKLLAFGAVLLILMAPVATAQSRVSATEFNPSAEGAQSDPTKGIKAGESVFGFVNMEYCHTGPALNPNNGVVTAEITLTAPDWLTAIPPEPVTWTPPATEASQEKKCTKEQAQVSFTIAQDAPEGETGAITATITVTEDSNMDSSTYASVAGEHTVEIPVKVAEPEVDPITGGGGATNTTTPGGGDDPPAEESPLPAPLVPLLALIGLAALRRRHA